MERYSQTRPRFTLFTVFSEDPNQPTTQPYTTTCVVFTRTYISWGTKILPKSVDHLQKYLSKMAFHVKNATLEMV
jgi:hypothetical protein